MSCHEGVSCDSCMKSNFVGLRYKCLICYDYDLCAACYANSVSGIVSSNSSAGATSSRHGADHAVQCIPARSDFNIYYGGDTATAGSSALQPQSYTCPYCARMGFTLNLLQEHARASHSDVLSVQVICPICASQLNGDPSHVTDDLSTHISLVHRSTADLAATDDDHLSGMRQIRRLTQQARSSNFGSRPPRGPMMQLVESSGFTTSAPPSSSTASRDPIDPIAELLSQLSSVRSRAAAAQGISSNLHQLEMQLATAKHQLDRLPLRQMDMLRMGVTMQRGSTTENENQLAAATTKSGMTSAPAGATTAGLEGKNLTSNNNNSARSRYLLSRPIETLLSETEKLRMETLRANRSAYVQELLLATLLEDFSVDNSQQSSSSSSSFPLSNLSLMDRDLSNGLSSALPSLHNPTEHLFNGVGGNVVAAGSHQVQLSNERMNNGGTEPPGSDRLSDSVKHKPLTDNVDGNA